MYGYIRTKVTAGHHFRTDISVQKSERVKMLCRPSDPAKILDLPEDYKTGGQFFILLYFVFFFSLLLQTDCVASNQPLIFIYFHRKYL